MYFLLNMGIFHCYVSLPEGNLIMAFLCLSYHVLPPHEPHRFPRCEDYGIGSNPFSLSMADLLPDDLATMILVNQPQSFIWVAVFRSKGKDHDSKLYEISTTTLPSPKHPKIAGDLHEWEWLLVLSTATCCRWGLGWVGIRHGFSSVQNCWIWGGSASIDLAGAEGGWLNGRDVWNGKGSVGPNEKKGHSGMNTSYIMAWRCMKHVTHTVWIK